MLRSFAYLVWRDLRLAWRQQLDLMVGLVFFVVVAALFPLAMAPQPDLLQALGVPVILVTGLLANLLSLHRLFEADWHDGSLVQLMLLPLPQTLMVVAKMLAHVLTLSLPLSLMSVVLLMQYQLPMSLALPVIMAMLLMMLVLTALGALSSALTLGLPQASVLMALLHLPLCAPVVIFAGRAVYRQADDGMAEWWLLGALALGSWFFIPAAVAVALRLAVE